MTPEPAWIEHGGSAVCPVPAGNRVEVEWASGNRDTFDYGHVIRWLHIARYRDWTAFEEQQRMSKDDVPTKLLQDIREHLEADRLIELGRAMRREVDRCPIRQMCKQLDEIVAARLTNAGTMKGE